MISRQYRQKAPQSDVRLSPGSSVPRQAHHRRQTISVDAATRLRDSSIYHLIQGVNVRRLVNYYTFLMTVREPEPLLCDGAELRLCDSIVIVIEIAEDKIEFAPIVRQV